MRGQAKGPASPIRCGPLWRACLFSRLEVLALTASILRPAIASVSHDLLALLHVAKRVASFRFRNLDGECGAAHALGFRSVVNGSGVGCWLVRGLHPATAMPLRSPIGLDPANAVPTQLRTTGPCGPIIHLSMDMPGLAQHRPFGQEVPSRPQ